MEHHPFTWIRDPSRKAVFWMFTGLAVLTMVALQVLGGPLRTREAPAGIVSFELAGDLEAAERMVAAWDARARIYGGLNLGLDYLFIDAYVGAIGLGCVLVATKLRPDRGWLKAGGPILAWAVVLAGALDCLENYALIRLLLGAQAEILPVLARWCAIPKFLMVLIGLLYIAIGLVVSLAPGRSRQGQSAA